MNLENTRQRLKGLLKPVVKLLVKIGVTPDAATVIGLAVTLFACWLVYRGLFLAGGLVLIGGSLLDALDGSIARMTGTSSKGGAALDSSLDRVGEIAVFTAVLAGKAGSEHDSLLFVIPAAMGGSLMVSYVRARAEGLGIECKAGLFTRTERLVLAIAGIVLASLLPWGTDVILWSCSVIAAGSWFTALQRLLKAVRDGRGVPLD
ncbi:CDP-alcohol phosphatidyltransferase [Candidatus Fermentibacteria bacterium]|nr:MAG: CDP-alcohol phosphatidyltransferase [Candidatus Fermentibacteria bacterium]